MICICTDPTMGEATNSIDVGLYAIGAVVYYFFDLIIIFITCFLNVNL